ncbi:MAG: ABC transporter permease [Candidatus Altiarchaeota archaeon]|nr:ABC transporter permease [Candidatus Altiarchaeota archaeon]
MIRDYLKLAVGSITHRKLRSWLTMVGIFIGVMAVVALVSLGDGLQNTINGEFEKVGTNRIAIMPGGGGGEAALFSAGGLASGKLTQKDVDTVRSVKGISMASGFLMKSVRVDYSGETKYLTLFCISTGQEDMRLLGELPFFEIEKGRMLQPQDNSRATIGKSVADEVFDKEIGLNDKLLIEGREFTVAGIYKKASEPVHNFKVVLTRYACDIMFNITDNDVSTISSKVSAGFNTTRVAYDVKEKLRRERGQKEGEEDFSVITPEDIMRIFLSVVGIVQTVLTGIAAISLVVGGIGIMNTMYTSVLERTREIGIMKSVGAKNSDILTLFMTEAGILGAVGGVIGIALGLALAKAVEYVAVASGLELLRVTVSVPLVAGALAFSFIMGSLSGIMPAMRAAGMKPVDALRK